MPNVPDIQVLRLLRSHSQGGFGTKLSGQRRQDPLVCLRQLDRTTVRDPAVLPDDGHEPRRIAAANDDRTPVQLHMGLGVQVPFPPITVSSSPARCLLTVDPPPEPAVLSWRGPRRQVEHDCDPVHCGVYAPQGL